jgi:anaerobic ribonucleoside-triphosphate reductase
VDTAIQKLSDMGFLEKIRDDPEEFEVKRIVKAKLGPNELEAIKKRLTEYATDNTDRD